METKKCISCNNLKSHSDFYINKMNSDGLYGSCVDCRRLYRKNYYLRTKTIAKKQAASWSRNKKQTCPLFLLANKIRTNTWKAVTGPNYKKTTIKFKFLQCDQVTLLKHLNQTYVDRYKQKAPKYCGKLLNIDHIVPLSSAKNEKELLKLAHFTNLQLLTPPDNRIKRIAEGV